MVDREMTIGGFQMEFVSISGVINHMTCYNSSALIGGNINLNKNPLKFIYSEKATNFFDFSTLLLTGTT